VPAPFQAAARLQTDCKPARSARNAPRRAAGKQMPLNVEFVVDCRGHLKERVRGQSALKALHLPFAPSDGELGFLAAAALLKSLRTDPP
jgi:hypothetical protein